MCFGCLPFVAAEARSSVLGGVLHLPSCSNWNPVHPGLKHQGRSEEPLRGLRPVADGCCGIFMPVQKPSLSQKFVGEMQVLNTLNSLGKSAATQTYFELEVLDFRENESSVCCHSSLMTQCKSITAHY